MPDAVYIHTLDMEASIVAKVLRLLD